ncbi:MAG: hypothetical protein ACOVMN_11345 [Flexibacteraceae bacterium]
MISQSKILGYNADSPKTPYKVHQQVLWFNYFKKGKSTALGGACDLKLRF